MRFPCELPTYHVRRTDAPSIDGNIHKPVWQSIEPVWLLPTVGDAADDRGRPAGDISLFDDPGGQADRAPDNAQSGHEYQPTALRIAQTDTHLCLAFQCVDRDIWGSYRRRDDPLYDEEVVEAFLSPTGDVAHYYEFEVSPRNVVFDARVTSPDLDRATMTVDTSWDCSGLQTGVHVHGELHDRPAIFRAPGGRTGKPGWWSVEIAIPFEAFPEVGTPQPGDMWRANFYRIDRIEPPEFSAWSPTLQIPANFHAPARFGYLVFESD